ncbi:ImmA/IrrE family metallo-endopeptidase [bacterium]|nr:ImmA/IrrE family metallo-endopeptidase [bacterium]
MHNDNGFQPNWASAPGDTINDILSKKNVNLNDFASQLGQSISSTQALLEGRVAMTMTTARQLEDILGPSVEFWMSRDDKFRKNAYRISGADQQWLSRLPLRDMIKWEWIPQNLLPSEEFSSCLSFFDISSIEEWDKKYSTILTKAAFKTSNTYDSIFAPTVTWLRQGEILSNDLKCDKWDSDGLIAALPHMKALTRDKEPSSFIPKLQSLCADNGVAVVIAPTPTGCHASGATRFLNTKKAIIQLSMRYRSDDHFWFAFFHEIGHLLSHVQGNIHLRNSDEIEDIFEAEANVFAENVLIPEEYRNQLSRMRKNKYDIVRFAQRVKVSPGIVVGQLQHSGRIRYKDFNSLKRRYRWLD